MALSPELAALVGQMTPEERAQLAAAAGATGEISEAEARDILNQIEGGLGGLVSDFINSDQGIPAGAAPVTDQERKLAFDLIGSLAPDGPAPYFEVFGIPPQVQGFLLERLQAALDPVLWRLRDPETRQAMGERLLGAVAICGRHWGWDAGAVADVLRDTGPWDQDAPEVAPELDQAEDAEPEGGQAGPAGTAEPAATEVPWVDVDPPPVAS